MLGLKALSRPMLGTGPLVVGGFAVLVGIGAFGGGVFMELARAGALVTLLAQAIIELRRGQRRFLTSPLFLLSVIGVVFFSIVQSIWVPEGPWPTEVRNITLFIDSKAEAVILSFCMACLVLYLFTSRAFDNKDPFRGSNVPTVPNFLIFFLFTLAGAVTAFDVTLHSLIVAEIRIPPFFAKVRFVVPPLIALSFALLVRSAPARGHWHKAILSVFVLSCLGGLIYGGESKVIMFTMAALMMYALRLFDFSFAQMVLMVLAGLLVVLVFVQIVQYSRWKVSSTPVQISSNFVRIFQVKGVWRQTETGYCLENVLKAHADKPIKMLEQLFWVEALVPRSLWPDKPSLSLGKEYAVKYCKKKPSEVGWHSSSITLLGQPVIKGGIVGLILHAGILLLALAAVEKYNANRRDLSTAFVVAMLPWLIDFDQDFSMYIANAVKFSLVMAVLFIPVRMIEYRAGRTRMQT